MYSYCFDNSVDAIGLCENLLTTIHCEAEKCTTNTRIYDLIDITLDVTPQNQFDLDNYMAHYKSHDLIDTPILLLHILRYHQHDEKSDENQINSQRIQFSDTI